MWMHEKDTRFSKLRRLIEVSFLDISSLKYLVETFRHRIRNQEKKLNKKHWKIVYDARFAVAGLQPRYTCSKINRCIWIFSFKIVRKIFLREGGGCHRNNVGLVGLLGQMWRESSPVVSPWWNEKWWGKKLKKKNLIEVVWRVVLSTHPTRKYVLLVDMSWLRHLQRQLNGNAVATTVRRVG